MFAFVMSPERSIVDPLDQPLYRGVIVANSEVGERSLSLMGFWFREICGNHIIWGAKQIAEIRLTHVGQIRNRWRIAARDARAYLDAPTQPDRDALRETVKVIAATKEEVLDALFQKRIANVTKKQLGQAYDEVIEQEDGDPRSKWGFAQGLTRLAGKLPYADERQQLDRAAGQVLKIAF